MAEYIIIATPIYFEYIGGAFRESELVGAKIRTFSVDVTSFSTLINKFNAYVDELEQTDTSCYRVSVDKAPGPPRALAGFPTERERGGKLNRVTHEREAKNQALARARKERDQQS